MSFLKSTLHANSQTNRRVEYLIAMTRREEDVNIKELKEQRTIRVTVVLAISKVSLHHFEKKDFFLDEDLRSSIS